MQNGRKTTETDEERVIEEWEGGGCTSCFEGFFGDDEVDDCPYTADADIKRRRIHMMQNSPHNLRI